MVEHLCSVHEALGLIPSPAEASARLTLVVSACRGQKQGDQKFLVILSLIRS